MFLRMMMDRIVTTYLNSETESMHVIKEFNICEGNKILILGKNGGTRAAMRAPHGDE